LAALSDKRPALVFIGFMGAGKSKAARAAREAGLESLDADLELERALGSPIGEFFAAHGEDEFRAREQELVVELLDGADGGALALGGGSVLSERVRRALERHVVVWLDVGIDETWERVEGSSRPLARDRERFAELHAERAPIYESLADAVVTGRRDVVRGALPALRALVELPRDQRLGRLPGVHRPRAARQLLAARRRAGLRHRRARRAGLRRSGLGRGETDRDPRR
jgi:shikimate kinase/3-dehydroquinate synthase